MRPKREPVRHNQQTYMVTSETWGRRNLFAKDRWAKLFLDTLYHYRGSAYLLHEFALMPDHFHILMTPLTSLERAVQFIKGGFSHRAKIELQSNMEIWQKGFADHRIRDARDYSEHVRYMQSNPVRKKLCEHAHQYPYSSARLGFELDEAPQRLKPPAAAAAYDAAEAASFQTSENGTADQDAAPLQTTENAAADQDAAPLQTVQNAGRHRGSAEAAPLQTRPHRTPAGRGPGNRNVVCNKP